MTVEAAILQVKVLTSAGLTAIGRNSFAHDWNTGGVITFSEDDSTIPTRKRVQQGQD